MSDRMKIFPAIGVRPTTDLDRMKEEGGNTFMAAAKTLADDEREENETAEAVTNDSPDEAVAVDDAAGEKSLLPPTPRP